LEVFDGNEGEIREKRKKLTGEKWSVISGQRSVELSLIRLRRRTKKLIQMATVGRERQ